MLLRNFKLLGLLLVVGSGAFAMDRGDSSVSGWRCPEHTCSRAALLVRSGTAIAAGAGAFYLTAGEENRCVCVEGEVYCVTAPRYPAVKGAAVTFMGAGLWGLRQAIWGYDQYLRAIHAEHNCLTDHKDPAHRV